MSLRMLEAYNQNTIIKWKSYFLFKSMFPKILHPQKQPSKSTIFYYLKILFYKIFGTQ